MKKAKQRLKNALYDEGKVVAISLIILAFVLSITLGILIQSWWLNRGLNNQPLFNVENPDQDLIVPTQYQVR